MKMMNDGTWTIPDSCEKHGVPTLCLGWMDPRVEIPVSTEVSSRVSSSRGICSSDRLNERIIYLHVMFEKIG